MNMLSLQLKYYAKQELLLTILKPYVMKKFFLLSVFSVFGLSMTFLLSSCDKDSENQTPTITSFLVKPLTVNANGVVYVHVYANDADFDVLNYNYSVTGGSVQKDGAVAIWTVPSAPGNYTVKVSVDDGNGGEAGKEVSLTVLDPVTQISGVAKFSDVSAGNLDLSGSKVTLGDFTTGAVVKTTTLQGSGQRAVFNIPDVPLGNYRLIIWKDNDNSGNESMGDYFGWYGSGPLYGPDFHEIQPVAGQTFSCNITIYLGVK
jgi:hypothetical protein